jgi:hypothetical protein
MTINFALDKNVLSLAQRRASLNNKTDNNMKLFLAAFIATFGKQFSLKDGDEPTEEQMIGFMKSLSFAGEDGVIVSSEQKAHLDLFSSKALEAFKAANEANKEATTVDVVAFMGANTFVPSETLVQLQATATEVEQLKTTKTELEGTVTSLQSDATLGKKYLGLKREEAIRLYKGAAGDSASEAVIKLFKDADDAAIDGLLTQYTKAITQKFSGSCASCGSVDFKFQSSLSGEGEEHKNSAVNTDVSAEAIYARFNKPSMNIGRE